MALIGKIRNNMWFVVILLGLALFAFVLMDYFSSNNRSNVAASNELGTVNGTEISAREFFNMEQVLYAGDDQTDRFQAKEYLWNFYVNKAIIDQEAEDLGLSVSGEELMELQFGNRLSPIIQQRFMNPQTRQVDRQSLNQLRQQIQNNQLRPDQKRYWAVQEKEIITNRLQTKLATLVNKGMVTPTWMAEDQLSKAQYSFDLAYVKVPFAEVADADANVTEADLRTYFDENKALYTKDKETRTAAYAIIDVLPTAEDTASIIDEMNAIKEEFAEASNDTTFVEYNYGQILPSYALAADLAPEMADTIFAFSKNSIVGPIKVGRSFQVVKVLDRRMAPDSVEARHIFRQINPQQPNSLEVQRELLDSLKKLLVAGTHSFDSLAIKNGQDIAAQDGGDLGSFPKGKYTPIMENNAFFDMEIGEYKVFQSSAGLHLMQVTNRYFETKEDALKLAIISKNIIPSEETQNAMYEKALTVASENRSVEDLKNFASANPGWRFELSAPLDNTAFRVQGISSTDAGRNIVKYIYQNGVNVEDVSADVFVVEDPQLFYNKQLVVAGLESIIPAGTPRLEDVESIIRPDVLKQKKGEYLKNALSGQSLSSVADKYLVNLDTARNVNTNAAFIPGMGNEPKILAALENVDNGAQVGPIVGQNGVYLLNVLSRRKNIGGSNLANVKRQLNQRYGQAAYTQLMTALKEKADIEDARSNFY